jgi:hypothetical protein
MLFSPRIFAIAAVASSLCILAEAKKVSPFIPGDSECELDSDCEGGLDCIQLSAFQKKCLPISCAKGAGQALLDFGFSPDDYSKKIMAQMGVVEEKDFFNMTEEQNVLLKEALKENVPPMDVFNANFTACLYPNEDRGRALRTKQEQRQLATEQKNMYGIQWGVNGIASYFGKSTYGQWFGGSFAANLISNCVGFLGGFDFGIDFLIQLWTFRDEDETPEDGDPGNTFYVPIFTDGTFGLQVGWFQADGTSGSYVVELTFGLSFGISVGGFNICFNRLDIYF